jgi:hypothetical protein
MKDTYEEKTETTQFILGIFAAAVFVLFAFEHFMLGIFAAFGVAIVALEAFKNDLKEEISMLKAFPQKFVAVMQTVRIQVVARAGKLLRITRQKNLLKRNKFFRTRKLFSA